MYIKKQKWPDETRHSHEELSQWGLLHSYKILEIIILIFMYIYYQHTFRK